LASTFTESAAQALQDAAEEAGARHQRAVEPRHILLALFRRKVGTVARLLRTLHVERESLLDAVTESLPRRREGPPPDEPAELPYTPRAETVLEAAAREAEEANRSQVAVTDLLLALATERGISRTLLEGSGVTERALRPELGRERDELAAEPETEPEGGPDEAPGRVTEARPADAARPGEVERMRPPLPEPPPAEEPAAERPDEAPTPDRGRAPGVKREGPQPPDFLRLDPTDPEPLYRQIAGGIREAAATGRLEAGQRLLPVRALADAADLAPGTVARAYRELEREGVLETRGTQGTFIAARDRHGPPAHERRARLVESLRPVAVSAFHLGAREEELRAALEEAMAGILTEKRE